LKSRPKETPGAAQLAGAGCCADAVVAATTAREKRSSRADAARVKSFRVIGDPYQET
jgi:hydroxyethylthiazole kinase-like sugar kinase family protein